MAVTPEELSQFNNESVGLFLERLRQTAHLVSEVLKSGDVDVLDPHVVAANDILVGMQHALRKVLDRNGDSLYPEIVLTVPREIRADLTPPVYFDNDGASELLVAKTFQELLREDIEDMIPN